MTDQVSNIVNQESVWRECRLFVVSSEVNLVLQQLLLLLRHVVIFVVVVVVVAVIIHNEAILTHEATYIGSRHVTLAHAHMHTKHHQSSGYKNNKSD